MIRFSNFQISALTFILFFLNTYHLFASAENEDLTALYRAIHQSQETKDSKDNCDKAITLFRNQLTDAGFNGTDSQVAELLYVMLLEAIAADAAANEGVEYPSVLREVAAFNATRNQATWIKERAMSDITWHFRKKTQYFDTLPEVNEEGFAAYLNTLRSLTTPAQIMPRYQEDQTFHCSSLNIERQLIENYSIIRSFVMDILVDEIKTAGFAGTGSQISELLHLRRLEAKAIGDIEEEKNLKRLGQDLFSSRLFYISHDVSQPPLRHTYSEIDEAFLKYLDSLRSNTSPAQTLVNESSRPKGKPLIFERIHARLKERDN